jgi:hypothetical protein
MVDEFKNGKELEPTDRNHELRAVALISKDDESESASAMMKSRNHGDELLMKVGCARLWLTTKHRNAMSIKRNQLITMVLQLGQRIQSE